MPNSLFPIKPDEFWAAFSERLQSEWNDPSVPQKYNHAKPWTEHVTNMVRGLDSKFSCKAYMEYWPRIDVSYFSEDNPNWGKWAMEAAIELENGVNWKEELCKLLIVNAGLKVLIAYENDPKQIESVLDEFKDIHASRKYLTSNCGWLFIFGPRLLPAQSDFVAFAFDGNHMKNITAGRRTIQ